MNNEYKYGKVNTFLSVIISIVSPVVAWFIDYRALYVFVAFFVYFALYCWYVDKKDKH